MALWLVSVTQTKYNGISVISELKPYTKEPRDPMPAPPNSQLLQ